MGKNDLSPLWLQINATPEVLAEKTAVRLQLALKLLITQMLQHHLDQQRCITLVFLNLDLICQSSHKQLNIAINRRLHEYAQSICKLHAGLTAKRPQQPATSRCSLENKDNKLGGKITACGRTRCFVKPGSDGAQSTKGVFYLVVAPEPGQAVGVHDAEDFTLRILPADVVLVPAV